jgi:hypothetical protein
VKAFETPPTKAQGSEAPLKSDIHKKLNEALVKADLLPLSVPKPTLKTPETLKAPLPEKVQHQNDTLVPRASIHASLHLPLVAETGHLNSTSTRATASHENSSLNHSKLVEPVVKGPSSPLTNDSDTRNLSLATSSQTPPISPGNGTSARNQSQNSTFDLKEEDEVSPIIVEKVQKQDYRKATIAVREAFPKIVYLNGKTEANPLSMTELHQNTSSQTSIEL